MAFTEPKNGHRVLNKAKIIELEGNKRKARHEAATRKVEGRGDVEAGRSETLHAKIRRRQQRLSAEDARFAPLSEGEEAFLTDGHARRNMHGVTFAEQNLKETATRFFRRIRKGNQRRVEREQVAQTEALDDMDVVIPNRGKGRQFGRAVLNRMI